ncbi:GNAT family N-acetyltransferase [Actinobaculum sp. 313]|uniref:GNAT family N-acetyltransferase n=1 Tax=Actinobaculum sp. 313 TaxID=2495645 RepID=UPI000D526EB5|nr:GNAT family N-acetyltransferase [Actinobaculum sp. 313]AWE42040.1 hypothetical protein DDD63_03880 [Actinobaculum sp. 313]
MADNIGRQEDGSGNGDLLGPGDALSAGLQRIEPGLEYLSRVVDFDKRIFGRDAWPRAVWRYELAQRGRYMAYVEANGEIAALGAIAGVPEAEVLTVGVDPRWRRRGLARRLLRELLDIALDQGRSSSFLRYELVTVARRPFMNSRGSGR